MRSRCGRRAAATRQLASSHDPQGRVGVVMGPAKGLQYGSEAWLSQSRWPEALISHANKHETGRTGAAKGKGRFGAAGR
jgi:hypothetical protein